MKLLIKNTLPLLFTGFGFVLGADRYPEELIVAQNRPGSPWQPATRTAQQMLMDEADVYTSITNSIPDFLSDVLQRAPTLQITDRHLENAKKVVEKNNKKKCKPLMPCLFAGLLYFKESGSSFLGWCADMGSVAIMIKSGWQLWENHQTVQQSQVVLNMLSTQKTTNLRTQREQAKTRLEEEARKTAEKKANSLGSKLKKAISRDKKKDKQN